MYLKYYIATTLVLQITGAGMILSKVGEPKKGNYNLVEFFSSAIIALLNGIAFWKVFF